MSSQESSGSIYGRTPRARQDKFHIFSATSHELCVNMCAVYFLAHDVILHLASFAGSFAVPGSENFTNVCLQVRRHPAAKPRAKPKS